MLILHARSLHSTVPARSARRGLPCFCQVPAIVIRMCVGQQPRMQGRCALAISQRPLGDTVVTCRSGGGAHAVEAVPVQVHLEADLAARLQRALQQQRQVLDLAPLPPVRPRVAVGHQARRGAEDGVYYLRGGDG